MSAYICLARHETACRIWSAFSWEGMARARSRYAAKPIPPPVPNTVMAAPLAVAVTTADRLMTCFGPGVSPIAEMSWDARQVARVPSSIPSAAAL